MTGSDSWSAIDDRFPRLYWRLDEEAYVAFGRYGTLHEAAEGEIVVKEGMPSMSFFLVLEGEVALTAKGQEVARVGEHFSFGEMGMLLDLPRAGTATATKPSKLLELTRVDMQLMQEKEPVWSTRLYRVLAECLAEYLHKLALAQRSGG
jgi:CRP-like cAMP-binding protein